MTPTPHESDWQRIEREAHEQVIADIVANELVPLEYGGVVAWTQCRFGRTDDLSLAHRAGAPFGESPMSICGEMIPAPIMRLKLTPNLVRTLGRCRYCDAEYAKHKENAA